MIKKNKRLLNLVRKAVDASFKDGKLQEKKAKDLIVDFKKLDKAQAIFALKEYLRGLKRMVNKNTLIVESAISLSSPDLSKIKKEISKDFKVSQTKQVINLTILGGIKVKLGDVILDNSLISKIKEVGRAIAS
ncbi:F0F1 ATP synthase subunit delta [Candidatus Daviesbacteria bacterium]|nr:F0F1 ATP synthase subunit delta [Candidatus Daviesbacteria bacterium]